MNDRQTFSDATQLAAIREAQTSISKDQRLTPGEREYHRRVLDAVADRIEDAMRRRAAAKREPRG